MAGFPAGGSALTSLTTSFTIDILGGKDQKRTLIHTGMAVLMGITIVVFHALNSTSVIDAVYRLASYTYGPLLGLFTFGLIWKRKVRDGWVPVIAVIAPILCLVLDMNSVKWFNGYHFSYELLLMNAAFTIIGLWLAVKPKNQE
jgi:Na+/proline symporter